MKDFVKKCPFLCFTILLALIVGVGAAARYLPFRSFSPGAASPPASRAPSSAAVPSRVSVSSRPVSSAPASSLSSSSAPDSASSAVPAGKPALPSGEMVSPDYFRDAIFVGDSLTEGLMDYGNLDEAQYFCHVGLNIYQLFETPKKDDTSGLTLEETLSRKKFRKVYLHLGINELGTATTSYFVKHYAAAIEQIRELEPDALIFVESIYPVTKEKSDSDEVFKNSTIRERNKGLSTLSNGKNIFYLDLTPVLDDGNGNMRADCSGDDVHPKAKYYPLICDRIRKTTAEALNSAGR